jgi:PAS domain S-box-containing protein
MNAAQIPRIRGAAEQAEPGTIEQDMLAAIVESSDDAIISKDLDGIITSWNAAARRLFGYSAEEIIGRPISVLMPEKRHDDMAAILGRIRRGERVEHYETVRVTKEGRMVPVSLSVSPIRDGTGRIVGAAKIARDITDRKLAEAERERLLDAAQRAVQVRDMFISVAGHEFRTPLNALTLQLYNLRSALSDRAHRAAVEKAQREVVRLSLLTHQLLDVARMASGTFTLDVGPMDLSELVTEAVARMQENASATGSRIDLRTPGPVIGRWDRSRLDQVVTNLLANAVKFGQGSPVAVTVDSEEALVRVRVRDHGIGVAVEDRERIFGRFERGVSERSYGGLGLGLWIAQQIVSAHGGRIGVESPDGDGAMFFFELSR